MGVIVREVALNKGKLSGEGGSLRRLAALVVVYLIPKGTYEA